MNFFGHASVALWHDDAAAHVFGTMLPDFAGMVGTRVIGAAPETSLQRGIDLHHKTDDAFHGAPIFVELCRSALSEMEGLGVQRASARAVAHVGTELLLDGWLAHDLDAVAAYREAMRAGPSLLDSVQLRGVDGMARARWLLARLTPAPVPEAYRQPEFVTERLVFALSSRPRLALTPDATHLVNDWLTRAQPRVEAVAPELMRSVRERLIAGGY